MTISKTKVKSKHNTAMQSFHKKPSLWWWVTKPKFGYKRMSSLEDKKESHILIIWMFTVTLTYKTANQPLCITLWLMTMHHHTKFGDYRFTASEDLVRTKFHWHLKFRLNTGIYLFSSSSSSSFPQDTQAYNKISLNRAWLQKNQKFKRYSTSSHILIIWTSVRPWPWR